MRKITTTRPLLVLDRTRVQDELRRAAVAAIDAANYERGHRHLLLVCINDFIVGLVIVALSMRMAGSDVAEVVFYLGLIRALCWPMWTVLLTRWLEDNG